MNEREECFPVVCFLLDEVNHKCPDDLVGLLNAVPEHLFHFIYFINKVHHILVVVSGLDSQLFNGLITLHKDCTMFVVCLELAIDSSG